MYIPSWIERVAQTAVTGEIQPRRHRLLGDSVAGGPHGWVVDLGCGDARLLDHVSPPRYTGIDSFERNIRRAKQRQGRKKGRAFFVGDISTWPLHELAGADCVVVSSVTHHLDDDEVRVLFEGISREVSPEVIWVQDAEPTGLMGPLVTRLDRGDYLRTEEELSGLLRELSPEHQWDYANPLRSFRQFLLRINPQ